LEAASKSCGLEGNRAFWVRHALWRALDLTGATEMEKFFSLNKKNCTIGQSEKVEHIFY
jgi:hypothetical protein